MLRMHRSASGRNCTRYIHDKPYLLAALSDVVDGPSRLVGSSALVRGCPEMAMGSCIGSCHAVTTGGGEVGARPMGQCGRALSEIGEKQGLQP